MTELIFATNNANKVTEVKSLLDGSFLVRSLQEAGFGIDIPEPYETLEENAREKARVIHEMTNLNCFSEDTGLEVEALNGAPGVKSARYAGEPTDARKNMEKLLMDLTDIANRKARFRTVIALVLDHQYFQFEGICTGTILHEPAGDKGFGYDPIFVPDGSETAFGLMEMEEKNRFSHRKKAMQKLIEFLNTHHGKNQTDPS